MLLIVFIFVFDGIDRFFVNWENVGVFLEVLTRLKSFDLILFKVLVLIVVIYKVDV